MEIEKIKEIPTQTEEILDYVKLEKDDNQPLTQVQILIENSQETCVKLEEIENEPNSSSYTGCTGDSVDQLIKIGIEFTSSLCVMSHQS